MVKGLQNKVALVTGAAKALAVDCPALGARRGTYCIS